MTAKTGDYMCPARKTRLYYQLKRYTSKDAEMVTKTVTRTQLRSVKTKSQP